MVGLHLVHVMLTNNLWAITNALANFKLRKVVDFYQFDNAGATHVHEGLKDVRYYPETG